jgi:hypothetical protein
MTMGSIAGSTLATLVATGVSGILAGASLDQSLKQLPARRRLGALAFSAYSRASDLARGVVWYATLGALALATSVGAWVVAWREAPGSPRTHGLAAAAILTALHSAVTARAAPLNHSQKKAEDDPAQLTQIFDRFERWQALRCVLQVLAFIALLAAAAG